MPNKQAGWKYDARLSRITGVILVSSIKPCIGCPVYVSHDCIFTLPHIMPRVSLFVTCLFVSEVECPAGSYCPAGQGEPIPCSAGHYNPDVRVRKLSLILQ